MKTLTLDRGLVLFVLLAFLSAAFFALQVTVPKNISQAATYVYEDQQVLPRVASVPRAVSLPRSLPAPSQITISAPNVLSRILPEYPALALTNGIEGVAALSLFVSQAGQVENVLVKQSSGHAVLDDSAIKAAYGWKFAPAQNGAEKIAAEVVVPFRFQISN